MTNLYKILETNTDETKNQDTKRIDILFDLKGESYKLQDCKSSIQLICVCGSCDLFLQKNDKTDSITINNPCVTIYLDKDVTAELRNYKSDTKLVVEYLGENNE